MTHKIDIVIKADTDGIKIPDAYQMAFKNLLAFCHKNRGGYLRITLAPPFKRRSTGKNSQNHAINGFIQQICMMTGNDFDDAKIFLKRSAFKRGYPFKYDLNGDIVYSLNDGEPVPASETEISTIEAGYLIDEIKQFADENEITLIEKEEWR